MILSWKPLPPTNGTSKEKNWMLYSALRSNPRTSRRPQLLCVSSFYPTHAWRVTDRQRYSPDSQVSSLGSSWLEVQHHQSPLLPVCLHALAPCTPFTGRGRGSPAISHCSLCHAQLQSIPVSFRKVNSPVFITRFSEGHPSDVCNFVLSGFCFFF